MARAIKKPFAPCTVCTFASSHDGLGKRDSVDIFRYETTCSARVMYGPHLHWRQRINLRCLTRYFIKRLQLFSERWSTREGAILKEEQRVYSMFPFVIWNTLGDVSFNLGTRIIAKR